MIQPSNRSPYSVGALCALAALGTLIGTESCFAVTIPTVPVGNAGNVGDSHSYGTVGAVAYDYRIGTTEVTVGQYTEFLNAVAASDTYALYNPAMATDLNIAGIARSGSSGSYSYSVIGSSLAPVTYVSWADAARFSNWMHNGQPTGPQNAGTTEGGAYTLNGATTDAALLAVSRNANATWFVPSENEWYKAAYHKNDGPSGNYWDYATSSDALPYSAMPPGSDAPTPSNAANFFRSDLIVNDYDNGYAVTGSTTFNASQYYLTDAGAYSLSVSPYGTYDQGGNLLEWNDTNLVSNLDTYRMLRGGSWAGGAIDMDSDFRTGFNPSFEQKNFGFRIATVPEPSTAVLAVSACGLLWLLRRRFGRGSRG